VFNAGIAQIRRKHYHFGLPLKIPIPTMPLKKISILVLRKRLLKKSKNMIPQEMLLKQLSRKKGVKKNNQTHV